MASASGPKGQDPRTKQTDTFVLVPSPLFFFFETLSLTLHVPKVDFELLILLPPPLKYKGCKHIPPCLKHMVLRIKSRALWNLDKHYQPSYIPNHLDSPFEFLSLGVPKKWVFIWKQKSFPHPPTYLPDHPGFQRGMWTQLCTAASKRLVHTGYGLVPAGTEHLETLIKVGKEDLFSMLGLDGVLQLWF